MKVIIDGVSFDNPTRMRIEVDPAGETVGPWFVEFVGGPLRVRYGKDLGAVNLDTEGIVMPAYADATLRPMDANDWAETAKVAFGVWDGEGPAPNQSWWCQAPEATAALTTGPMRTIEAAPPPSWRDRDPLL